MCIFSGIWGVQDGDSSPRVKNFAICKVDWIHGEAMISGFEGEMRVEAYQAWAG